jgi:hypothetical protein
MRGWFQVWWSDHFSGFSRREAWGYGVWLFFGVLVLVPEIWAARWAASAPFPTISGTVAALEYDRPVLALVVAAVIVGGVYSSLRYPKTKTGVLPKKGRGGQPVGRRRPARRSGAPLPDRRRWTLHALGDTGAGTQRRRVLRSRARDHRRPHRRDQADINDEYPVGRTLYGLTALFWVIVPCLLAYPKRFAVDVPFSTLFSTVRSLERTRKPPAESSTKPTSNPTRPPLKP